MLINAKYGCNNLQTSFLHDNDFSSSKSLCAIYLNLVHTLAQFHLVHTFDIRTSIMSHAIHAYAVLYLTNDEGLRGKSGKAVSVFDWCSPSPLFAFIFILVGISHTSCFRKGGVCIAITSYIDSMFIVHVGLASHMSKVSPDIICLRVLCRCTKNSLFRARRIYKGVN